MCKMRCSKLKVFYLVSLSAVIFILCSVLTSPSSPPQYLKNHCFDKSSDLRVFLRGDYWVFMNYITPELMYHCYETITLATTADFTFLDNLIPSVYHWQGPVSLAVYAPGEDFYKAIESIIYLRKCESPLIKKYVTFHLIIDANHIQLRDNKTSLLSAYKSFENRSINCKEIPPYKTILKENTYREKHKLYFPINVARNIAIESALTYFILPIDIELYPSENFIFKFLAMINRNVTVLNEKKVYVLPHFELSENASIPETKLELKTMHENERAFWFHQKLCKRCHKIPSGDLWLAEPETNDLEVFLTVKRRGPWEPFYVITNKDPLFDERFTWEGQSNKMTQGYSLCLLDYGYAILNNAFLVHKPGVKKEKEQINRFRDAVRKTNKFKNRKVKPHMQMIYGFRKTCIL